MDGVRFQFCTANCRGRQLGDPSGAAAHLRMEQSRTLNGTSSRNCPLASPGGKLPGLTALRNRQGWLMRGGDRLVNECSWMSGICFSFYHSTYCCGDFKRSPPLISLFCQSVPKCRLPKNPASPRGKPRGRNHKQFITNEPHCLGSTRAAKPSLRSIRQTTPLGFAPFTQEKQL